MPSHPQQESTPLTSTASEEGPAHIRWATFNAETLSVQEPVGLDELPASLPGHATHWIDVEGSHDRQAVEALGARFQLHPLTQEDILNPHQRPKVEAFSEYLYIVFQMMHVHPETGRLETEQVSLIVTDHVLISFQEMAGPDVLAPIRRRLEDARSRVRRFGPDYLAYTLLDVVVDQYLIILEKLGDQIDDLEEDIEGGSSTQRIQQIGRLRRETMHLRRATWPLREVVQALQHEHTTFMDERHDAFLHDLYDHILRTAELIEASREVLTTLSDLHLAALSHRTNEIMRVLAGISTIFLPLTFLTGLYGMNFDPTASAWNMPELQWAWGYPMALTLMLAVGAGLFLFLRSRNWL